MNEPNWIACDTWNGDTFWTILVTVPGFNSCASGPVSISIDANNLSTGFTKSLWTFSACSSSGISSNVAFTLDEANFNTGDPVWITYAQVGGGLASCSYEVDKFSKPGPPAIHDHPTVPGPTTCGGTIVLPAPVSYEWVDTWQWGRSFDGVNFVPVGPVTTSPTDWIISSATSSDSGLWVLRVTNCFSAAIGGLVGPQYHITVEESAKFGQGCSGSGGFVPSLDLTGCLTQGATTHLKIANGLGGAMATILLGVNESSIPTGGGCSLLVYPVLPGFFVVPLGGVGSGAGSVDIPIVVPATAPPATIRLQAFVPDPGTMMGYSNTNGVTAVIQ